MGATETEEVKRGKCVVGMWCDGLQSFVGKAAVKLRVGPPAKVIVLAGLRGFSSGMLQYEVATYDYVSTTVSTLFTGQPVVRVVEGTATIAEDGSISFSTRTTAGRFGQKEWADLIDAMAEGLKGHDIPSAAMQIVGSFNMLDNPEGWV